MLTQNNSCCCAGHCCAGWWHRSAAGSCSRGPLCDPLPVGRSSCCWLISPQHPEEFLTMFLMCQSAAFACRQCFAPAGLNGAKAAACGANKYHLTHLHLLRGAGMSAFTLGKALCLFLAILSKESDHEPRLPSSGNFSPFC